MNGLFQLDVALLADLEERLWRLLLLRDYNTRVVLCGATLLGVASGVLGVYLLLRKRALLGDAISHATLPGVALAFLWTALAGFEKSLLVLLAGAAISGALGGVTVLLLRHVAKLREDAALGIVLSVFFGAGVALVSLVEHLPRRVAGLESFIYGRVAAMTGEDVVLATIVLSLVSLLAVFLNKEMKILCFDVEFARSQGWPVYLLDGLLICMVVATTIVGLQAVGLIMVIALLVVPPASARFWTNDLNKLLILSGLLGGTSCALGAIVSAALANLPSGATIVLISCSFFLISFVLGTKRGTLWQWWHHHQLRRQQDYMHMLRLCYERLESHGITPTVSTINSNPAISLIEILSRRKWSINFARRIANELERRGLMVLRGYDEVQLTSRGLVQAQEVVREHRLLELYMMEQADVEVVQADRAADYLEHGLSPEIVAELGESVQQQQPQLPPSPHPMDDTMGEDNRSL